MRKETDKVRVLIADPGIGYGHPTFLHALSFHAESELSSVVEVDPLTMEAGGNGILTKAAMRISRALYQQGGQGGLRTRFYENLRGANSINQAGFLNRLITEALEARLRSWDGIVIATHYLTGRACRSWRVETETGHLFVVQGDVHAHPGYAIPEADKVFVPVEDPVSPLSTRGIPQDRVCQIGFLVHPILLNATKDRDLDVCREQLTKGPLHLGFFLSGAFSRTHKEAIWDCLASCKELLTKGLARTTIVPMEDAAFGRKTEAFARSQLDLVTAFDSDTALDEPWQVRIVQPQGTKTDVIHRSHEIATQLNVFASMANERTPWPVVMTTFDSSLQIGEPSRQNHRWLEQRGMVATIHDPRRFGEMVQGLMTDGSRGWWHQLRQRLEKLPVNGVNNAWGEILTLDR